MNILFLCWDRKVKPQPWLLEQNSDINPFSLNPGFDMKAESQALVQAFTVRAVIANILRETHLGQNWESPIAGGLYAQPKHHHPISLQSLSKTKGTYNH